jgi:L-malate glycosyltransferase
MRIVLWGDGESPHLLKWARALAPRVELWVASSRGFASGFDALVPEERRLALHTTPNFEGGNAALLLELPAFARWLRRVKPDWIHAHYLSSHGTLAWLATRALGAPGHIAATAWGSDVLVAPQRSVWMRFALRRVLRASRVCTSDSRHMAERMREHGAGEVMVLPFGLEALPELGTDKDDALFFANRGLEPVYSPLRMIKSFAAVAAIWPAARLVVANDGSLLGAVKSRAFELGLQDQVRFVGRLGAAEQAQWYAKARWFFSLPASDAVSVSVLEAMAHGCIPLLSDLPANRELVTSGVNGLILADSAVPSQAGLDALLTRGAAIAEHNRGWVRQHAMFEPAVLEFLDRLRSVR